MAVTVADGAQLFRAKGCASCHDGPDTTAPFGEFPALGDAATWAATRQPGQSAHDYLWDSIRLPQAVIAPGFRPDGGPTNEMPTLQLSDTEIDAVVRYLLGPGG